MDSADVWTHPFLFQMDAELQPTGVAGVPPDYFAAGGQRWGNPLYAWERHVIDDYAWWCARLEKSFELYDVIRIDHFAGSTNIADSRQRQKMPASTLGSRGPA
jgi:4-alpha-glucanotransferase